MNDNKAFFALNYFYCLQKKFFLFSKALLLSKSSKNMQNHVKMKTKRVALERSVSDDNTCLSNLKTLFSPFASKAKFFQRKVEKLEKLERNFVPD